MTEEFRLETFADLKILQEIQEAFSSATGLAAVFADEQGNHLGEGSNFSKFCNQLRDFPEGRESCRLSNYLASKIAFRDKQPFIYKCHSGLVDMVVPIIVDSTLVGMMLAGQIRCIDEEFPTIEKMPSRFEWQTHHGFYPYYKEIEVLSRIRIESAARAMFLMANYIVQKSIAEMTQQKLNKQNRRLLKEIRTRHELENALREAELKALQHRINPHFMFNVLNSISRLIALGESDKAQEVLAAFTKMLRYSINDGDDIVTLQRELDYVNKYLYLQNLRFGNRVTYSINVDPNLLATRIPFFTLQPLVENAIVHGLEPKESGGIIWISGYVEQDKAIITISDNGLGIPEEKVELIKDLTSNRLRSNIDYPTGIGINNVHKRLTLFFGNLYAFEISSQVNMGTTVKLALPRSYPENAYKYCGSLSSTSFLPPR
ncbi:MAG TPA: histidine kinase [Corynebacteriales bacterium]|nr:histidine kinase [Mycobacteriales bacterium]